MPSADVYERRLRHRFGYELKLAMLSGLSSAREEWGPWHRPDAFDLADQLSNVAFLADGFAYSSLEFEVTIAGLERLLAFAGGLPALDLYLRQYVPLAFESSTLIAGALDHLDFSIDTREVSRAAAAIPHATIPHKIVTPVASGTDRSFRFWAISNFSLLPVVIVALIFAFVVFQDATARRNEADATLKSLLEHQRALIPSTQPSPSAIGPDSLQGSR